MRARVCAAGDVQAKVFHKGSEHARWALFVWEGALERGVGGCSGGPAQKKIAPSIRNLFQPPGSSVKILGAAGNLNAAVNDRQQAV
eukprot:1145617-Pelagomonas_calceolata.AAC.3